MTHQSQVLCYLSTNYHLKIDLSFQGNQLLQANFHQLAIDLKTVNFLGSLLSMLLFIDVGHESDLFLTIFGILIFHEVCFAKCLKSHLQNLAADFFAS
jgi:hypothetical protein